MRDDFSPGWAHGLKWAYLLLIVLLLLKSFATFIVFATSMGFIAAPAIAYYNYVAVTSDAVPAEHRPGGKLIVWNWIAVYVMAAFALAFLYTHFGG